LGQNLENINDGAEEDLQAFAKREKVDQFQTWIHCGPMVMTSGREFEGWWLSSVPPSNF